MTLRLIGLMGKSKSGKDTVGEMLSKHEPRGATLAFADKLKETVMDLFGATREDVYTEAGKDRDTGFPCFKCPACGSISATLEAPTQVVCNGCTAVGEPAAFRSTWTWRTVLQHVGTEGCRRVSDQVWVRHTMARANHLLGNFAPDEMRPTNHKPKLFVAITDCRFKSEMAAIKEAGGEVWRIRRPETDLKAQGLAKHASETEMDTIPDSEFHRVINNDATLKVLHAKAIEGLNEFLRSHE